MTRYRLVAEHLTQWGVGEMCRVLRCLAAVTTTGSSGRPVLSLFEYIEIFYNRERSHSTLCYVSPDQFEPYISIIAA